MLSNRLAKPALVAIAAAAVASSLSSAQPVQAAAPAWLDRLNSWRLSSGVSPLTENTTWDQGDYDHALYMVKNDQVTHYELSTLPYYTVDGDTAARNGNIEVNSSTAFTDSQAIDWWMAAPFHAMGMMDPRLMSTGFGSYREVKTGWDAGFTLDVLRGNTFTGGTFPVFFPGAGSTVPLTTYQGGEFPDPLQACPGYAAPTGLPAFIELGGNVSTTVTAHSFTGDGVALAHCVIDSTNPAVGSDLTYRGGVIVVPQQPLVPGVKYVVNLTVNGAAYTWSFGVTDTGLFTSGLPATWTNLGGVGTSGSAVSTWGSTRTDVFVRGSDNGLWQRTWDGTSWGTWQSLGGILSSDPAAVSWGTNRIDVFVRGTDSGLWQRTWNGTSWSNWNSLGGILTSGPDVSSQGANSLDVFVRGTDGGLWQRSWNGTTWANWVSLGGYLTSDPSAVSWGAGRIDVFVRGTDLGLWQRSWTGSGWTNWQSLGGLLTSGAGAASCASGHLDVFVSGSDLATYQLGYNGAWGTWKRLGGAWNTDPSAVCQPATTAVTIAEVAPSGAVGTFTATGT
jgi:cysteine-rich secretory family protein